MKTIKLIKLTNKAHNVIASCQTCVQLEIADKYVQNFKEVTNNDEFYNKLCERIEQKKIELSCDFRI